MTGDNSLGEEGKKMFPPIAPEQDVSAFREKLHTEFLDQCGVPREYMTSTIGLRKPNVFDLAGMALRRLDQRIARWIEDELTQHEHKADYSDCELWDVTREDCVVLTLRVRGRFVAQTRIVTTHSYLKEPR